MATTAANNTEQDEVASRKFTRMDVAAAAQTDHPDRMLLTLGAVFSQLEGVHHLMVDIWADEHGDTPITRLAEELQEAIGSVAVAIEQSKPQTLQGLLVKHQVLRHCTMNEPITAEELSGDDTPTTDMRMVASLLRDLDALGRHGQ